MADLVIDRGHEYTNDIFILNDQVYIRVLTEKQTVTNYAWGPVEHRLTQSNEYMSWNYKTGVVRYMDYNTFDTQFKFFKYLKESWDNFIDDTTQDVLDFELYNYVFRSEHMF